MPSLDNKAETISEVLDWQVNMLVRESILQNVSVNKKVKITNIMIQDAKANALATIEKLLLEAVIGENEEYTIVSHEYNTDNGAVKQTIGDGEQEWKDPRNELRAEQRTTLKVVLYGEDE